MEKNNSMIGYNLVITIIINGIILNYLYKLNNHDCRCSDIPEKNGLISAYWFFILISTLSLFHIKSSVQIAILCFTFIYNLLINIQSIRFVRKLKKIKCNCSKEWERKFMYIINIIDISVYLILLITSVLIIIFFVYFMQKKK